MKIALACLLALAFMWSLGSHWWIVPLLVVIVVVLASGAG